MSYNNPTRNDLTDPVIELAYEEGHDADIPSSIGVYNETSGKQPTGSTKTTETDVEKGGARTNSSYSQQQDEATLDPVEVKEAAGENGERDPNEVWWDGPDDPENPQNWADKKKWGNVAVLAIVTLITYVNLPSKVCRFHVWNIDFWTDPLVLLSLRLVCPRSWLHSTNHPRPWPPSSSQSTFSVLHSGL